jgi:hypothetical protein
MAPETMPLADATTCFLFSIATGHYQYTQAMRSYSFAMVLASIAFPTTSSAALLGNGGFESATPTLIGAPEVVGVWYSDAAARVSADNGITAVEGLMMLRFDSTSTSTSAGSLTSADLHQSVDVSSLSSFIQTGTAIATLSGQFNRVAGNAQTDTELDLRIIAKSGVLGSATTLLGTGFVPFLSDGDPATWQTFQIPLLLPSDTTLIQVDVTAVENIQNNTSGTRTEFDGHYVDNLVLTVPEPATGALIGALLPALLTRRRRMRLEISSGHGV